MEQPSLAELTAMAAASDGPGFPPPSIGNFGGVDPLGLRQINFDLMDQVLPGLNNVARHIRPFVVVAWASRRALQIVERDGPAGVGEDSIRDFVDRIEVVFLWSQILEDPGIDI